MYDIVIRTCVHNENSATHQALVNFTVDVETAAHKMELRRAKEIHQRACVVERHQLAALSRPACRL